MKVQEACRHGESEECRKVRFTEAGIFSGGIVGSGFGALAAGAATTTLCAGIVIGTRGLGAPMCGMVLVGGGAFTGAKTGEKIGESTGEVIYEAIDD